VSNIHVLEAFSLYLILYPQLPVTASQFNVASLHVIAVTLGFCGVAQGVKLVNVSEEDQADTEELSELQADLTCHSYTVDEDKPVLVLEVVLRFAIKVHEPVPCSLRRTS
jgi:hypothetical protein